MLDVEFLVTQIAQKVQAGHTTTNAVKELRLLIGNNEEAIDMLKEAHRLYEERTGQIRELKDPASLRDTRILDWYQGSLPEDTWWPALSEYWRKSKGWTNNIINSVDQSSTKVVSLMQPALKPTIDTKGLVVGYVQSGKTANYTAVIAKAADVNYKLFIVLSGMTNSLRNQTQQRLQNELIDLHPERWMTLTDLHEDFRPGPLRNVDAQLSSDLILLAVVKKNANVLRRLLEWLRTANTTIRKNIPTLIIDDEADQASVNASRDPEERTTINRLILNILDLLPKAAYIAYTATPFANVFIDPVDTADLYPSDFIVSLPEPEEYFGASQIFGRERLSDEDDETVEQNLNMTRLVPLEDVLLLRPANRETRDQFEPELAQSLQNAIRYFWLSVAARIARRQIDSHTTMLVHTTLYTDVHDKIATLISQYRNQVLRNFSEPSRKNDEFRSFRQQWEYEQELVDSSEFGLSSTSYLQLKPYIKDAIEATEVVIEHSRSEDRLAFNGENPIQIAVGGNTLARGLTLEGLTVSYFIRPARSYDTLLQMGRWFGYRPGYADLPRMWMTGDLQSWFSDLATVEEEIRQDIRRYQDHGITPLDFAVRVRTHPELNITSRPKMRSAVRASISYNDRRIQTVVFKHTDLDWLEQNIEATRGLVASIVRLGTRKNINISSLVYENIPVGPILSFINNYNFHENNVELRADLIDGYIRSQNEDGALLHWNVVIRTVEANQQPKIDLGHGIEVHTLIRSRRNNNSVDAHIGALMSKGDRVIDLDLPRETINSTTDADLQDYRPSMLGLLVVYPISQYSPARPSSEVPPKRLDMNAASHVIGVAIVFPKSENMSEQEYMAADLSGIEREEILWSDEEQEYE